VDEVQVSDEAVKTVAETVNQMAFPNLEQAPEILDLRTKLTLIDTKINSLEEKPDIAKELESINDQIAVFSNRVQDSENEIEYLSKEDMARYQYFTDLIANLEDLISKIQDTEPMREDPAEDSAVLEQLELLNQRIKHLEELGKYSEIETFSGTTYIFCDVGDLNINAAEKISLIEGLPKFAPPMYKCGWDGTEGIEYSRVKFVPDAGSPLFDPINHSVKLSSIEPTLVEFYTSDDLPAKLPAVKKVFDLDYRDPAGLVSFSSNVLIQSDCAIELEEKNYSCERALRIGFHYEPITPATPGTPYRE